MGPRKGFQVLLNKEADGTQIHPLNLHDCWGQTSNIADTYYGVNVKGFHLLPYSIALITISLSILDIYIYGRIEM